MKIKFKKLHEGAVLPTKATPGSAAYDLYVPEDIIINKGRQIIPLGFAIEMELGYQALVEPRSGFSSKGMEGFYISKLVTYADCPISNRSAWPLVSPLETSSLEKEDFVALRPSRFDCDVVVGKIDADYRGGIGVIVSNRDNRTFMVKAGTRIAQLTFLKVEDAEWEETDTLSETDRDGGFGSTGTN